MDSTTVELILFLIRSLSLETVHGRRHLFEFQHYGGVFLGNGVRFFFFLLFINSLLKHKVRRYILRNKSLFCL